MSRFYVAAALAIGFAACTHPKPSSPAGQAELVQKANAELSAMRAQQPGIDALLANSAGYAVFPSVGSAGALYVGGAYGKGVLYQNGAVAGYVDVKQGSVGLTLGGKTFGELLILRTPYDVARLKSGKFEVGADVSAVVLTAGAEAKGTLDPNTSVVVRPHGGMMAELTVQGQQINFAPAG